MLNLLRKRRSTAGGAEIGPSSSKKQRFIDATEMLLDIAKESTDVFPPLKACLGGINALVKHYEESKDVEEKLGDLIPWLTKLKDNVTTPGPDNNCEEVGRRGQLTRSLEDIEERSRMLLDKGKVAKIVDKKQDSGMVIKLIEELRRAILIYQLAQQQSIDNQVTQLASSFNAFLKLREEAPGIKEKIESALTRLERLAVEGSTLGGEEESERKLILFEALEGVKDGLCPILERSSTAGYKENDADVRSVCGLAEDVRDAVMEYQFAQQTAIHEQNCRLIDSVDLSALNNCRRAQGAEYRHGNRRGCLKGTRDTVLNEIDSWAKNFTQSPVFWLNGLAGTGKSTIAQTTAERLFAEGHLGASFFCSRDFEDRSNLHLIFPTLAFQLAHRYPDFRSHFLSLLRSNPDVVHESLYSQMQKLITEPLRKTGVSTVIVIDALDECKDNEPSSAILSVLSRFVREIPGAKFFITGRPEPRIKTGFRLPLLVDSTDVFVLHDVHPSLVENDIRIFLQYELSELAQRRQLEGWPADGHVDLMCRRAAGLFVYAVATVKFLDSNIHLPEHRLDVILKLPESTAPEGKTRLNARTTLDSLYTSILQAAFGEEDPDVDSKVRAVVGTIVVVVNPLPPSAIAGLVGLGPKEVMLYLALIQSLLAIGEDSNQPVKPFHKSFPDFIVDPSRCTDTRFCVSPERQHSELTTNCLRLMTGELEHGLLSLPEYALNSEVKDLRARIDGRISIALRYACRSWHNHLTETRGDISDVVSYLRIFLEEKFLAWLEVLSVLGDAGSASVSLEKVMLWLQEVAKDNQLLDTAQDCFYFVTKFFEPINVSATHVYHSALELCPTSSIVRKLYYDRCHGITRFPRVMAGIPDSWDSTISYSGKDDYTSCTWSPCGQFIAAQTKETVEIRNQLTFELLAVLQPTNNIPLPTCPLAYSPDGRVIACGFSKAIVIWDIQTGGVAKEIECRWGVVSLAWSLDGRTLATTLGYGDSIPGVETYDIASGARLFIEKSKLGVFYHVWAWEKSFRFATMSQVSSPHTLNDLAIPISVSISEIGPSLIKVESSYVEAWGIFTSSPTIAFSPSTSCVAVWYPGRFTVLSNQTSSAYVVENCDITSFQFSSDGSRFAVSDREGIRVWERRSFGYDLHAQSLFRHSRFPAQNKPSLHFSPTFTSILYQHGDLLLQLRGLSSSPWTPKADRWYAAISHSGGYIATARESNNTVTIINLRSQTPSQLIDTGAGVEGLVITGNVLLVSNSKEVITWLLTAEGTVDGVSNNERAGRSDSIWTVSISSGHKELLGFRVEGQVGAIKADNIRPVVYHTGTGEFLKHVDRPRNFTRPQTPLYGPSNCHEYHYLRQNPPQHNTPPDGGWLISHTMGQAGWVVDLEGRHKFWLPVEWRKPWERENWHHDITTLFSTIGDEAVAIKF